jgi:catechol 2,3-dioxygenase-like lactoylglutathione lyase family enzyme
LVLVDDIDASIRFYELVAGAELVERLDQFALVEMKIGASGLALVAPSIATGSWARPEVTGGRNIDHFCIAVAAEAEALRDHLAQTATAIVEEQVHDDGYSFYVRDPSGNTVELKALSGRR